MYLEAPQTHERTPAVENVHKITTNVAKKERANTGVWLTMTSRDLPALDRFRKGFEAAGEYGAKNGEDDAGGAGETEDTSEVEDEDNKHVDKDRKDHLREGVNAGAEWGRRRIGARGTLLR